MIGDEKTALFVIISDTDDTFNFIVSIMYTQLFNLLCDRADDVYHGRLPVHVRCLLDKFAKKHDTAYQSGCFRCIISLIYKNAHFCIVLEIQNCQNQRNGGKKW